MDTNDGGADTFFSIIVPIYNIDEYLRKCVDSILNQSYKEFELVLVDDGSTDCCAKICDEYALKDERVKVIHKENGGLVSSRNQGVECAKGAYICHVDGDDWVNEDYLSVLKQKIVEYQRPDMLLFGTCYEYPQGREEIPCYVKEGYYDKKKLEEEIYPYMIYDKELPFFTGRVYPAAWNKCYKAELLKEHYCKDELITVAEDNAFTYECLYHAESLCVCNRVLYHYNRCNETSMISKYNQNYFSQVRRMIRYMWERFSGGDEKMENQMQVFTAAWHIMAVFHEVRYLTIGQCVKKVKRELRQDKLLEWNGKNLPCIPRVYLWFLKKKLVLPLVIVTKFVVNRRKI